MISITLKGESEMTSTLMTSVDKGLALNLLRQMLLIRRFEERTIDILMQGKLASTMCHASIGQEAVAAGACSALEQGDFVTSTHRGHGHLVARGGHLGRMMAELMGKQTGYCKGRGGSMHMMDISLGHLGSNGIVGGHFGIAVGAAMWCRLSGREAVTMCFFGDGAVSEGICHEALNISALHRLPIVFMCENNQYAMSLPWAKSTAQPEFAVRAQAYGICGLDVDGQDPIAVRTAALEAVNRARGGLGPTLIGAHTYRFLGHSRADPSAYRSKDEEAAWKTRDPIVLLKRRLEEADLVAAQEYTSMESEITMALDEAVKFAEASPEAPTDSIYEDIYA